jgi:hypothetical protein
VLWGDPPAAGSVAINGNRIYANRGDQVLVIGTYLNWTLDGSGCGLDLSGTPLFNTVGCYDPTYAGTTDTYRGVVAIDAGVVAKYVAWESATPRSTHDYVSYGQYGSIALQGTPFPYCPATPNCKSENP